MSTRWALCVGVDEYADPKLQSLAFCGADAAGVGRVLERAGYVVRTLRTGVGLADAPTRANVGAWLDKACRGAVPGDTVLVHFACHGALLPPTRQPLLALEDSQVSLPETFLDLSWVEGRLRECAAGVRVLFCDACHAGADLSSRGSRASVAAADDNDNAAAQDRQLSAFFQRLVEDADGVAILAASSASETTQEWYEKQHGVFSYFLMEALHGRADTAGKGYVTVADICDYVGFKVAKWSSDYGFDLQHPTARVENSAMGELPVAIYRGDPSGPLPTKPLHQPVELSPSAVQHKLQSRGAFLPELVAAVEIVCVLKDVLNGPQTAGRHAKYLTMRLRACEEMIKHLVTVFDQSPDLSNIGVIAAPIKMLTDTMDRARAKLEKINLMSSVKYRLTAVSIAGDLKLLSQELHHNIGILTASLAVWNMSSAPQSTPQSTPQPAKSQTSRGTALWEKRFPGRTSVSRQEFGQLVQEVTPSIPDECTALVARGSDMVTEEDFEAAFEDALESLDPVAVETSRKNVIEGIDAETDRALNVTDAEAKAMVEELGGSDKLAELAGGARALQRLVELQDLANNAHRDMVALQTDTASRQDDVETLKEQGRHLNLQINALENAKDELESLAYYTDKYGNDHPKAREAASAWQEAMEDDDLDGLSLPDNMEALEDLEKSLTKEFKSISKRIKAAAVGSGGKVALVEAHAVYQQRKEAVEQFFRQQTLTWQENISGRGGLPVHGTGPAGSSSGVALDDLQAFLRDSFQQVSGQLATLGSDLQDASRDITSSKKAVKQLNGLVARMGQVA